MYNLSLSLLGGMYFWDYMDLYIVRSFFLMGTSVSVCVCVSVCVSVRA